MRKFERINENIRYCYVIKGQGQNTTSPNINKILQRTVQLGTTETTHMCSHCDHQKDSGTSKRPVIKQKILLNEIKCSYRPSVGELFFVPISCTIYTAGIVHFSIKLN